MKFKLRYIPLILLALLLVTVGILLKTGGLEKIIHNLMTPKEPPEITDPNVDETFDFSDGMTITLPGDFAKEPTAHCITNENYTIRNKRIPKSTITPHEGMPFPTLQVYMHAMLPTMAHTASEDDVTFKMHGETLYAECKSVSSFSSLTSFSVQNTGDMQCILLYETDDAFWCLSFYSPTLDFDTVKAQAFEWAKTVTIED